MPIVTLRSISPLINTKMLILELVNREKGHFRRIGLLRVWYEDVTAKILQRSEGEEMFPCEEYRDGHHVIRII